MKCPNCGKEEFEQLPLLNSNILATSGYVQELVEAYVCVNCRRVELYMPQQYIEKRQQHKAAEIEKQKQQEEHDKKIAELKFRMYELEEIISDGNRTVKEVNSAQQELEKIRKELHIFPNQWGYVI